MATPDIQSAINNVIPNQGQMASFGTQASHILLWGLLVVIVLGIAGFIGFVFLQNIKFNKKIFIYEKIDGKIRKVGKDRGMEMKYGTAGDSVFYLKKRKKYLPRPNIQMGKNEYWFFIRDDAEWINFSLEDLDEQMRKAGAFFVDRDMRYARTQIQKGLKNEYGEKKSFLKENLGIIIPIAGIAIVLIFMWLIVDKIGAIGDRLNAGVQLGQAYMDTAGKVTDKLNNVLAATNNICMNSGYKPGG